MTGPPNESGPRMVTGGPENDPAEVSLSSAIVPLTDDIPSTPPRGPEAHKALARKLRIPRNAADKLIILTRDNDPFYKGTDAHWTDARWFAALLERFGFHLGAHPKRVHYTAASHKVALPDGNPYLNIHKHWHRLAVASASARILGLVDVESMVDRRNDDAIENALARQVPVSKPRLYTAGTYYDLPELILPEKLDSVTGGLLTPGLFGYDFDPADARPVMIEVWAEKSTQNDILDPLCKQLHANYVEGTGFESITQTVKFLRRAEQYGKRAHVIYISDFDMAGNGMPIAVARQVQFWLEDLGIDVDVTVDTTVLTKEQVDKYELPRIPAKEDDTRRENFEERNGKGVVELDALEALRPGELARIVRAEVERFTDHDYGKRLNRLQRGNRFNPEPDVGPADLINDAWIGLGGPYLENEMRDLVEQADAFAGEQAERITEIMDETAEQLQEFTDAAGALGDQARALGADIEVELPERPEPEITDAAPDVMFDSRRHWLKQLDVFRKNQRLDDLNLGRFVDDEEES